MPYRAWQSLKDCSTCQAVVVLYDSSCLMHMGAARAGHKPGDTLLGPICRRAMSSEQGNYLANLALYPGRRTLLLHSGVNATLAAATILGRPLRQCIYTCPLTCIHCAAHDQSPKVENFRLMLEDHKLAAQARSFLS